MKIQEKIIQLESDLNKLKSLAEKYPDLEEYKDRWRTYLSAKSANSQAINFYFGNTCGCCNDAPLII